MLGDKLPSPASPPTLATHGDVVTFNAGAGDLRPAVGVRLAHRRHPGGALLSLSLLSAPVLRCPLVFLTLPSIPSPLAARRPCPVGSHSTPPTPSPPSLSLVYTRGSQTQETLDFCAANNIAADIELISPKDLNHAMVRPPPRPAAPHSSKAPAPRYYNDLQPYESFTFRSRYYNDSQSPRPSRLASQAVRTACPAIAPL
jgi:hypothetical protein